MCELDCAFLNAEKALELKELLRNLQEESGRIEAGKAKCRALVQQTLLT